MASSSSSNTDPTSSACRFSASDRYRRPPPPPPPPETPAAGSDDFVEPWTPPMQSTAKSRRAPPVRDAAVAPGPRGEKGGGVAHDWAPYAAMVIGFLILLWVDTGLIPEAAARGFGPKLSPDVVARVGSRRGSRLAAWATSCAFLSGGSGSSSAATACRQLQLAGLLARRVFPTARASNGSSWAYRRHSAAAVRLEPETWVLEYQKSMLFEGTRLIPAAAELFVSKCSMAVRRVRRRLFVFKLLLRRA
ncbi:hypothetical protein PR202_gb26005 [Eleusine coracana subsp. coracana]|uniref:Uncharacterized protein n=1 Tax=Eleusine coracana subsp. coracana TaxID=191504 RepID=A0AAV5FQF2_ELECO|nr:hypothetical protein PR202_gb26005 [Eleusine coracana subsp. coracana]